MISFRRSPILIALLVMTALSASPALADSDRNALDSTGVEVGRYRLQVTSYGSQLATLDGRYRIVKWPEISTKLPLAPSECRPWSGSMAFTFTSLCWDAASRDDALWYPQGITGSGESGWSGVASDDHYVIASWYKRTTATVAGSVASRISILDAKVGGSYHYRHVTLAVPGTVNGRLGLVPLAVHAGGAAWYGRYLYVSTGYAIWRFDLNHFYDTKAGPANAYVLPATAVYRSLTVNGRRAMLSSISLDRSTNPPQLVSAQYRADTTVPTQVIRWPFSSASLASSGGIVSSVRDYTIDGDSSIDQVQGVESHNNTYLFTSTNRKLERVRPESTSLRASFPWGPKLPDGGSAVPEDLYGDLTKNQLWGLSELPGSRYLWYVSFREALGIP